MSTSPVLRITPDILRGEPERGGDPADDPQAVRERRLRTVYFEVFGCQMNKLDAELMVASFLERGYRITDRLEDAGAAFYVTCSVRRHAEERVFSKVGRLRRRKERDPDFVVGVLGCIPQHAAEEVLKRQPHVDILCGTTEFLRLPEFLEEARGGRRPRIAVDPGARVSFVRRRNLGPTPFQAYVSVMRGCDQACTFCIVPRTRGREISRPVADVVDEVRALVDGGVTEVTLLGQTVNSYGKRLAPGRRLGLHHLLSQLDRIRGLRRLRFITSHPLFMSAGLIDSMADLGSVCEYLHLPVQSGADPVLRRMRRGYTVDRYRRIVERCRERIPGFVLATDFIVGFPGETDEDFRRTCELLEELQFQGSFVFKYSPRPETEAARLDDDVPAEVKQERNRRLLEIQQKVSERLYGERIGTVQEVLVEGRSKSDPSRLTGRNRAHQIVVFPAPAGVDLAGRYLPVRIRETTALTLVGQLVETGVTPAIIPVEAVGPLEPGAPSGR